MLPSDAAMLALRTTVAVTRATHVRVLRIGGPSALELLDGVTTSRLFIRENQMLHTLMLDESSHIFADAFVCQDEDSLILLAEGPTKAQLIAHLQQSSRDASIEDLEATYQVWSIDGPFAWEATAALLGPEVLGAPYLSFLSLRGVICLRAGKTGEYGFQLLVPDDQAGPLWERLSAIGADHGLAEASLAALDQCALENWHFSMRHLDRSLQLTPAELQLQWRVDYDKQFIGAEAVRARRAKPLRRATCFVSAKELSQGDTVLLDGERVGQVMAVGHSSVRGDWVGIALLQSGLAWPGIRFEVSTAGGPVEICTRSPPLLNNRSLHVDPHRHSHQTRARDDFPPLVVS